MEKDGMVMDGNGYDYNNIVYELKNGNGNVKEYDNIGELEFEGEYLYGKRNVKNSRNAKKGINRKHRSFNKQVS